MKRQLIIGGAMAWGLLTMGIVPGHTQDEGAAPPDASILEAAAPVINAQFVEMTYKSVCQRVPDPATYNYYVEALTSHTRTFAQVREAISASCRTAQAPDAHCSHVKGLDGLCTEKSTN